METLPLVGTLQKELVSDTYPQTHTQPMGVTSSHMGQTAVGEGCLLCCFAGRFNFTLIPLLM